MAFTDILAQLLADSRTRAFAMGRPLVTLSYAQSMDGCITTRRGASLALSCEESKFLTHQLRAAHDGILVGIGTVLADDPRLTARMVGGPHPQPVILDGNLRIPHNSRLLSRPDSKPWLVCGDGTAAEDWHRLEEIGVRVIAVPIDQQGYLDLDQTLRVLFELGMVSLMVEGGARVIASFLRRRLVDQVVVTVSPVWVGGLPVSETSLDREGCFPQWIHPEMKKFGRDWVIWGRIGEGKYETAGPVFPGATSG